jgi:hypothetical protein
MSYDFIYAVLRILKRFKPLGTTSNFSILTLLKPLLAE